MEFFHFVYYPCLFVCVFFSFSYFQFCLLRLRDTIVFVGGQNWEIVSRNRGKTEIMKRAWYFNSFLKTEFKLCFLIWFLSFVRFVILLLTLLTTYLLVCLLHGIGLQSTVLDIGYANSVMFCKIHKEIIQETSTKNQHFPKCFVPSFG